MKLGSGSSSHFVMAMVQFAQREQGEIIERIRSSLHLPATFEFKFHKATPIQRRAFFNELRKQSFRIRIVALDKSALGQPEKSLSGEDLIIAYISQLSLRTEELDMTNDILIIDGAIKSFTRKLRVKLTEECKEMSRTRPFKKIVGADSRREAGLQLADMIAGATMRFVRDDDDTYYRLFADKVVDLWSVSEEV